MSERLFDLARNSSSLVELLGQRARHQPHQRYIFLQDGETQERYLTFKELDRQARTIGATLERLKVRGERVLLLYPPGLGYIAAFFGCLYAGAIAVPSYPPRLNRPDPRLRAILIDAQPKVALATADILSNMERRFAHTPELKTLHWLGTEELNGDLALAEEWRAPDVDRATLAFLQYTSGSTAAPKGVMLTHGNLLHNLTLIHSCFEHTPQSQGVIWLPPYHDMGLIGGILQPLYGGFPVVLLSPVAFLQRPLRWLQAISRYQATTSGGPDFAYNLCIQQITPEQRATLNLSSWELAFNGAEPIRHQTLERFVETFGPCGFRREAFYPCYGLAEGTLIVSGGAKAARPIVHSFEAEALERERLLKIAPEGDGSQTLVGCGQTLQDQEILIANPEQLTRCQPHQVGEIWVSGPSVAQGYWERPADTAHTFQAHLTDTSEGPFMRTGDLGFLKDGELFVAGRIKDLIIIRGRNHYPQDIELTVEQSHPALQPSAGAAFSIEVDGAERLVVVQELKRSHRKADVEKVVAAIRQAVVQEHELQVYALVLVKPLSVPKTSSGKIQRYLCQSQFLENDLKVIKHSTLDGADNGGQTAEEGDSFIRKALLVVGSDRERQSLLEIYLGEQVAQMCGRSAAQLNLQQSLVELGMDTSKAVELGNHIRANLGVTIPAEELPDDLCVSQLTARVLDRLKATVGDSPQQGMEKR